MPCRIQDVLSDSYGLTRAGAIVPQGRGIVQGQGQNGKTYDSKEML
jgi:hypothetical protein